MKRLLLKLEVLVVFCIAPTLLWADQSTKALWQAIKSPNHYVLMRHALAPGLGDPEHFKVDVCSTQRNLSNEGREQARATGLMFKQQGIATAAVYSSQWCRCLDTATELGLGPVQQMPFLNSFFQMPENKKVAIKNTNAWLQSTPWQGPTILVTHQVNITALTGIFPQSGEMVVIRLDDAKQVEVVGTIATLQ